MSRTPLPPREEWTQWLVEHEESDPISKAVRRVKDLEAMGAQVLPLAVDVTVAEQVQDALAMVESRFGAVHGVFHAAGVLNDGLIALKTERDIEEVFAAKLYGTLVLDQAFQSRSLDFMLLFSSISAFVAPVGQIDYVAANSFLNAFAESCRDRRPYPVVAIDWGIWKVSAWSRRPPHRSLIPIGRASKSPAVVKRAWHTRCSRRITSWETALPRSIGFQVKSPRRGTGWLANTGCFAATRWCPQPAMWSCFGPR